MIGNDLYVTIGPTLLLALCNPKSLVKGQYERYLSKEMSELLRNCKLGITFELWNIMETQLDMEFVLFENAKVSVQNELQRWTDVLEEGDAKVPFYGIDNTIDLLEKYLDVLARQHDIVTCVNKHEFESWVSTTQNLKNVYIPFFESIFVLSNRGWIFRKVERDTVLIETGHVVKSKSLNSFSFLASAKPQLTIGDHEFNFNKGSSLLAILGYLCKEERNPHENHFFNDMLEELGITFDEKKLAKNAKNLQQKIKNDSHIKDFIICNDEIVYINPLYSKVSKS